MKHYPSKQSLLFRSLIIAGGLTASKVAVYALTNSLSILASAGDSLMDFFISVINGIFLFSASKPADKNHPYGHGKIESLAGLLQGVVIGLVAIFVAVFAIRRFSNPVQIEEPVAGIVAVSLALIVNLWHTRNLRISMNATQSQVMTTEYVHYATDSLAYFGVLLSFIVFKLTGSVIGDLIISLIIVLFLIKNVISILHNSVNELVDRQLPDHFVSEVSTHIRSHHPSVIGFHDLRTRRVGDTKFIEFHVVIKDVVHFDEAHAITESLVEKLTKQYPGSVVNIHMDPASSGASQDQCH